MFCSGWGFGAGLGIFGVILFILFWAIIIWAIIALVRAIMNKTDDWHRGDYRGKDRDGNKGRLFGRYGEDEESDSALRILRERYAKGEISKEEFEMRKNDIMRQ